MTDTHPTLTAMGIQHPQQIVSYTLSQTRSDSDTLRIKYKRPPGSFLPVTRKYVFGRFASEQMADSGTARTETIYEISPQLSNALLELDGILNKTVNSSELKQHILAEIERIEQDFQGEMASLKKLLSQLGD